MPRFKLGCFCCGGTGSISSTSSGGSSKLSEFDYAGIGGGGGYSPHSWEKGGYGDGNGWFPHDWDLAGTGGSKGLETIDGGRLGKPKLGSRAECWLRNHHCGEPGCRSGMGGGLHSDDLGRGDLGNKNGETPDGPPGAPKPSRKAMGSSGNGSNSQSVREALGGGSGNRPNKGCGGKPPVKARHLSL